ncbi:Protein FAM185A [Anabarilius grahami]|uniref:Protein FAM185A n=1 Tax=Anabarilius grahami TaxID=495550 RepID=A0A3N0YDM6_ANAGA|nr:Protein FAM185A [Anabarilius grahami]
MFACVITQRLRPVACLGSVQRALISQAVRSFSDAPATTKDLNKPIKQWELLVSPYTKVRCHLGCNISIKPLDPHAFPEADRAFITVHVTDANQTLNVDKFHVDYDDQSNELQILSDEVDINVTVELTAPIKCDLLIKTKDKGNVKIKNMESDLCHVHTERGHCVLKSVKGHEVQVQSTGGNVTGLKTLHGNVDISTSVDSNIDIKKIQGTTMNLSTEHGDLKVKAIYAESTSLSTSSGNIQIGHVHGEALVRSETGNIAIDSSSGALKVFTAAGNIHAYVGEDGTAELHSQQADRAFITVHVTDANQTLNVDKFHVDYDDQSNELQILSDEVDINVTVELTAPIKCDLLIKTKDKGNVKIKNMESDLCHVHTERGHCVLKSVKGHEVQVQSTGGNVTGLKTLHGNVDISTSVDSNIDIKKIQGTTMNLSTEHGDLKVKAIYAESTSLSTSSGNIQIGHVHGEALVRSETGNIAIDSSSGALKVFTAAGNIHAYVGEDGSAELHSQQGAVSVRVASTMKTAVRLCGTSVSISSEIVCQETERTSADGKTTVTAHLNEGMYEEQWIKATAEKGAVDLRSQSWFETLRFGAQS